MLNIRWRQIDNKMSINKCTQQQQAYYIYGCISSYAFLAVHTEALDNMCSNCYFQRIILDPIL